MMMMMMMMMIIIIIIIIIIGIVNWHQEELQKLDRKTRKLLTIHVQHHPKADVDRLYVRRKQGGRGLMQLEAAHAVEITKLMEYVDRKEDPLIQVVRTHQHKTRQETFISYNNNNNNNNNNSRIHTSSNNFYAEPNYKKNILLLFSPLWCPSFFLFLSVLLS